MHGLLVHAFCFMSNHVHLVVEPTQESLHRGVHAFSSRYAQYFNRKYKRKGYLFQNRYRSILGEDGIYLKRLLRYVHLNPVEAKLVFYPHLYRWSSFKAYFGDAAYVWLHTDAILRKFGSTQQESREKLLSHTQMKIDAEFDRKEILKAYRTGIFGDEDELSDPILTTDKINHSKAKPSINALVALVCTSFKMSSEELVSQSKKMVSVDGRSVLALIVRKYQLWPMQEVATQLNKTSGTMSRLADRAESRQDLVTIASELHTQLID